MEQKLLTAQNVRDLKKCPLYSKDGQGYEAEAILKIFLPAGSWTWYVTEGEEENGDWLFFGLVVSSPYERELGYFRLSELADLKVKVCGVPMGIERDIFFRPTKLKDIK